MTTPADTPALKLAFAETGPIPNEQCAVKDALLFHYLKGDLAEVSPAKLVSTSRRIFKFLENPNGTAADTDTE